MATSNASEIEELVTCQICLYEYDRETRKPKFLQCHHTICLLCFQAARQQDTITCPFCRRCTSKDNTSNGEEWILPTNNYVLELLRLNGTPVLNPSLSDAVSTELADAEEDAEQLRIALAMSSLEMNEDEALNEALYQSLLSQQQERDIPVSMSAIPRTNSTRVHVNSTTPTTPSSAPPPPPPHRMSPAPPPPPPSSAMSSRSPNIYNNNGPPTPPTRGSSMQRSSGSMTSLSSMVVPPPPPMVVPPPPPPPSVVAYAYQQSSAEPEDFESRFASRFRPLQQMPSPEPFTSCQKLYSTRQRRT